METVKATKTKKPAGKTRGAGRSRTWAALVYPESAAEGWRETLEELHITGFISPLHDSDVNPDGTQKKPHYHVLLMWEGVKSAEQAAEVWNLIKAVPEPRPVNSARGYARYLCHLDNPEKHQYSPADVVALGGADWEAVTHLPTDDYAAVKEMCMYIRKNKIYSFAQFFDLCMEKYDEWANTLIRGGSLGIIKEYQRSLYWEVQQGIQHAAEEQRRIDREDLDADETERETGMPRFDMDTGEILGEE
jgi:hypothetical protein